MLDELELTEAHAEAIIQQAIDFEVYTDDMPETKKDKMEAAHEIVAFGIDSWIDNDIRPDAKDENVAAAGQQIATIFEIAGIEIDGEEIVYGDLPDLEGAANTGDGDDEAPFDVNDVIEGYEDLTAATKIKKIKALDLDPDDDDDYNTLVGIAEWEEAQDTPTARVLDYLTDIIGEPEPTTSSHMPPPDVDDEPAPVAESTVEDEPWDKKSLKVLEKEDLKEVAAKFGVEFPKRLTDAGRARTIDAILEAQEASDQPAAEGDDGDAEDEPWDGYNDAEIEDVIEVINDDERTLEELEYVLEYEQSAAQPSPEIVEALEARIAELQEPEPEPEPPAKVSRRGRRGAKTEDPDTNDDVDNAVAKDDAKEAKVSRRGKKPAFVVAYSLNGSSELEITAEGKHMALGAVLDAIESGADSVTITNMIV